MILMCGPAGSGKSIFARRLEAEGMVRLSIDEEAWDRGARTMPLLPDLQDEIEGHLRNRLLALVAAGDDVVLDYSFWSRCERDAYRDLLQPFGVVPEVIYMATARNVALGRIRARRAGHANDYPLSEEVAAAYFDQFEVPTADEGPLTVIR